MSIEEDWYKILKVSPTATQAQITSAYRAQSLISHPDKVAADKKAEANIATARLNQAYKVLNDPTLRKEYDRKRRVAKQPSPQLISPASTPTRCNSPRRVSATDIAKDDARPKAVASPATPIKSHLRTRGTISSVPSETTKRSKEAPHIQDEVAPVERSLVSQAKQPLFAFDHHAGSHRQTVLEWLSGTNIDYFPFQRKTYPLSAYAAQPRDAPGKGQLQGPYGRYFPIHDREHLYMNLMDANVPIKHKLSIEDMDILRLLMLAHRYSLHVYELPFEEEGRDRFVFSWRKFGRAIEVLLDPMVRPPCEQEPPGRS